MKVSLINIKQKNNPYGLFGIYPLGPLYLGTLLKQNGYEVKVFDENRDPVFNEKKGTFHPDILHSDFVGLTVISPAANRALSFLRELQKQKPEIRTACGGPHLLDDQQAEEFIQYTDVVVQNEAENCIEEIVKGNRKGIYRCEPMQTLNDLPVPDFKLLDKTGKKLRDFFRLTPISTTRGCPRNCEFCAVSNIHGKVIRRRSPSLVIEEMKQRYKEGFRQIFFTDDNFSVYPSKRVPLLEAMIRMREEGFVFKSIIIQDEVMGLLKGGNEYIDRMRKAGIKTVMLGIESFEDSMLEAMQKSHKSSDSEKAIHLLQDAGMIIYSFGMARPEWDTRESIKKQFQKLKQLGITYADMTIETPVPGTRYWEKSKSKIIALKNGKPDWDQWDYLTPVISPAYMTPGGFQKEVRKNMRRFYSIGRGLKQLLKGKISQGLTILYVWYMAGKMYSKAQ